MATQVVPVPMQVDCLPAYATRSNMELLLSLLTAQDVVLAEISRESAAMLEDAKILRSLTEQVKSKQARRTGDSYILDVLFPLGRSAPLYLKLVEKPKKVYFKRRKFGDGDFQCDLTVLSTVPPFRPLTYTKTSKLHSDAHILKGQITVQASQTGIVKFEKVCFTIGTAEFPNGKVHLLVTCKDPRLSPFLVEGVSVRTKRITIREIVTRREKEAELFSN